MSQDILYQAIITTLAALVTAALGFVTQLLARRNREANEEKRREVGEIAEVVSSHVAERRARALEALAERLPMAADVDQFMSVLENLSSRVAAVEAHSTVDTAPPAAWAVVQDLVSDYHRQALDQARVQFWFSIAAATVGFSLIVFMAATAQDSTSLTLLLRVTPGVAIDTVAALFFKQASETRQRATELYDRLRTDNQQTKALELVDSISNEIVRSMVKAQMALHMAGINAPTIDSEILLRHAGGLVVPATTKKEGSG